MLRKTISHYIKTGFLLLCIGRMHAWAMDYQSYRLEFSSAFLEQHHGKTLQIKGEAFCGGYGEFYEIKKEDVLYETDIQHSYQSEQQRTVFDEEGNKKIIPFHYEDIKLPNCEITSIIVHGVRHHYHLLYNEGIKEKPHVISFLCRAGCQ